jgi:hypothetical protein
VEWIAHQQVELRSFLEINVFKILILTTNVILQQKLQIDIRITLFLKGILLIIKLNRKLIIRFPC